MSHLTDDYVKLDHGQALDLAAQYAREHGKPFVVVGTADLGFGPVAEEDVAEMEATYSSFAAAVARPSSLVKTVRVCPDGQLEAA